MKFKNLLFLALAGLLFFTSCKKEDDIVPNDPVTVDFGDAPSSSIITSGTVEVITENQIRYHVLIFGGLVTSTIVETETGLVVVDVAFGLIPNSGTELRAYVDVINKPINVVITHGHQDHYGNMNHFTDATVYAETNNAAVLLADSNFTNLYSGSVNAVTGSQVIAGVEFIFDNISHTEATENGFLYIPNHTALFPGDLVFNRSHAYIREYTPLDANDELDTWIAGLNAMKTLQGNYSRIFMGHNGYRTDVSVTIDENIAYLTDAQGLIKGTKALTAGGYASSVVEVTDELALLYPNYASGGLLLALPDSFFPGDPGANWFQ